MSNEEKLHYLDKLEAKQEFNRIRDKLGTIAPDNKVDELKAEISSLDRKNTKSQNKQSFNLINEMVQKELARQKQKAEEQRQNELIERIQMQKNQRRKKQTSKTIFEDEQLDDKDLFTVERNVSEQKKLEYKEHFMNLQIFLQFYKEKLMLTRKV